MIIDSSAIIAILTGEPERTAFIELLTADHIRVMSAVSLLETALVYESRVGIEGGGDIDHWILTAGVNLEPFDARQAEVARRAWRMYGKGRHPAALNFGDCCVYALAKVMNEPILCKGDDFSRTDIRVVKPEQT